jgi:adenine-specific DNA-methyltransferase
MTAPREKFQALLKKLFQFDNAELDFGIYRIMNHKRAVIERFIENDLIQGLDKELKRGAHAEQADLARQLAEATAKIRENFGDDALDAEGNLLKGQDLPLGKDYLVLRSRASGAKSSPELEAEIFNHLYAFFSRYYDDGDFMSLRRYSRRDKYAIPYNGEEVHLHWANADQYYIKTGENFTDYSYKHGGWTVRFKLRNADVEQNNVKGAKRFFIPRAGDIEVEAKAKTLSIPFEYRPLSADEEIRYGKGGAENGAAEGGNGKGKAKRKRGQEGILADTVADIHKAAKKEPDALAALLHEKRKAADGEPVTLLDHHLRAYTRSNSTDFFIHKDLKSFLERELDFYLKNELLNLDELEAGGESRSENWFQTLRAIKAIGHQIIAFVAQIENLEKRLFEKKKFITEVNYCVTLDRIPERFYPEVAKNKAQIAEWKRLFHIQEMKGDLATQEFTEPVQTAFLKANQSLVLDTKFFSKEFQDRLLSDQAFNNGSLALDDALNGLLIQSENFQAIRLLRARYANELQCIYIDPPYNTDAGPILYKNGYRSSTWITLIENRLLEATPLLKDAGILCVTIDDYQVHELAFLLDRLFQRTNQLGTAVIRNNPSGRSTVEGISISHEYAFFYRKTAAAKLARLPRSEKQLERFSVEEGVHVDWRNFRKDGGLVTHRAARPKQYYPIYVNAEKKALRIPDLSWDDNERKWIVLEKPAKGEVTILPIDENGKERVWSLNHISAKEKIADLEVRTSKKGDLQVYRRHIPTDGVLPRSLWDKKTYAAREYGSAALADLFGDSAVFSFAKSPFAVQDCIWVAGLNEESDECVFDFFAGSGTTGQAVIAMNREDGANRTYVLVEMGDYFDTVLKPRLEKVVYSKDWKDGKPVSRHGSSHAFKYLRLESYEDALDNITFDAGESQASLQLEDYVLSYMLEFETKSSDTLLNIAKLDTPFDYKLRRHGKDEPLAVDLPETFNYLIGLHVETRRVYDNEGTRYLVYRGTAEGRRTAVIWRTTRDWKKEEFEADREFVAKQKLAEGAEDVFVNTDSFIEGARSLDPVFKRRMFSDD